MTFMELNAAEVPVRGRRDGGSQSGIARARVLLISTYDLGHQPFGLASPATWLTDAGFEVTSLDLSRRQLSSVDVSTATSSRSTCRCTPPRGLRSRS